MGSTLRSCSATGCRPSWSPTALGGGLILPALSCTPASSFPQHPWRQIMSFFSTSVPPHPTFCVLVTPTHFLCIRHSGMNHRFCKRGHAAKSASSMGLSSELCHSNSLVPWSPQSNVAPLLIPWDSAHKAKPQTCPAFWEARILASLNKILVCLVL